jgi:hypothetical protein
MSLPSQVREWWTSVKARSARTPAQLRWDETGLTQIWGTDASERQVRLAWEQITEGFAYKRDCFTVDQIRLVLGNDELRLWIEVAEDDPCYKELLSELPSRLLGFPSVDSWWETVAFPAFETKWTKLYARDANRAVRS